MAAEELSVENVLLKEVPAAAILFDDAVDKVKAPKKVGRNLHQFREGRRFTQPAPDEIGYA